MKKHGRQSVKINSNVSVRSAAAVVGQKENQGPLGGCFDIVMNDAEWNEETWEKTESKMQREAIKLALQKSNISPEDTDYIFSGDLLNQCIGAGFGIRKLGIPFFGLYGACSTMIEGFSLGAMVIDGDFAKNVVAATSSHFCTAERQYRTPLEYGGQRTPTAQWTVTGAGAALLSSKGSGPYITEITTGKILDMGVKDPNNMGGAMAPAAFDTLLTHFRDFARGPSDYDMIFTGDLGKVGREILIELMEKEGYDISKNYKDCGCMIFDLNEQDVHSGGSGCGCVAATLCGHILKELENKTLNRILVIGTGALLSPTSSLQGESVPGIAHAVVISNKEAD